MKTTTRILFACLVLYAATAALALTATWQHVIEPTSTGLVEPVELTLQNGIIFLAVFVVFTVVMVRFMRVAHVSLSFLLAIALIAGAQFILSAWAPVFWSILIAIALAIALQCTPLVATHDIAIMLGIGGIAGILGMSLTPLIACGVLALLSLYDVLSVYRTRHMVTLAGRMLETGAVFGFLIPTSLAGFMTRRQDALESRSVMMLGSGDIGLPLVLATSAMSQSVGAAVIVAVCSLGGVGVMQWLFARQQQSAPMAALPPIALSAIFGYAVAIALGI